MLTPVTKSFCGLMDKRNGYEQMCLLSSEFKTTERLIQFGFIQTYRISVLIHLNLNFSFDSSELMGF